MTKLDRIPWILVAVKPNLVKSHESLYQKNKKCSWRGMSLNGMAIETNPDSKLSTLLSWNGGAPHSIGTKREPCRCAEGKSVQQRRWKCRNFQDPSSQDLGGPESSCVYQMGSVSILLSATGSREQRAQVKGAIGTAEFGFIWAEVLPTDNKKSRPKISMISNNRTWMKWWQTRREPRGLAGF